MRIEDRIDQLYELPLGSFVPARNALAREVRREGHREAADRIQKLPKPSIPAWLLNQLHRRDPDLIGRLREAGHDLLVFSGGGEAYPAAAAAHRRAHAEVIERAEALAAAAGLPLSPLQRDRLDNAVRALAAWGRRDPPELPGRLVSEVEPPPLELLLEVAPERPRQTRAAAVPSTPNREPERPPRTEPVDEQQAEAEAKVSWLEVRLRRLERQRAEKAGAHEATRDDHRLRLDMAERLDQEAEDLEQRAAIARRRADEERVAVDAARSRVEAAAEALAGIEREIEAARAELEEARAAIRPASGRR